VIGHAGEEARGGDHPVEQVVTFGPTLGIDLTQAFAQTFVIGALEHIDFHVVETLDQRFPNRLVERNADVIPDMLRYQVEEGIIVQVQAVQSQDREAVRQ